jgi:hypothetical protein
MQEFRLTKKGLSVALLDAIAEFFLETLLFFLLYQITYNRDTDAYVGRILALFFDPNMLLKSERLLIIILFFLFFTGTVRRYFYKKKNYLIKYGSDILYITDHPSKKTKEIPVDWLLAVEDTPFRIVLQHKGDGRYITRIWWIAFRRDKDSTMIYKDIENFELLYHELLQKIQDNQNPQA